MRWTKSQGNAATLASRAMDKADRDALVRQINTCASHRKLLQDRLDRLSG